MNIFVVDSHAIYRRGLVASLELLDDVDAVDCANGTAAAWEHPALADADVLIVDPSIVGGGAFILAVGEALNARVIGCAIDCDDRAARAALEAGAVGFLRKDTLTLDVLEAALTAAVAGAMVVASSVLAETLREGAAGAARETPARARSGLAPPLSEREQRVLTLLADGHQTREIATQLCYSERTIKNVLHDVVTKLNVRSRSHAIAYAVREGLI
jgi:DNA-binding NarL/FixJ family response regulator